MAEGKEFKEHPRHLTMRDHLKKGVEKCPRRYKTLDANYTCTRGKGHTGRCEAGVSGGAPEGSGMGECVASWL